MLKYILLFITILMFVGCSCRSSYMEEISVVNSNDKYLSCKGIDFALAESQALLEHIYDRCARPHVFAKYLPCTPWVQRDAAQSESMINDRIKYIQSLAQHKKCNAKIIKDQKKDTKKEEAVNVILSSNNL